LRSIFRPFGQTTKTAGEARPMPDF